MRCAALTAFALVVARAQGTETKANPADYPAHVQLDTVTLAAEYLVHTIPIPKGNLIARDYLVVEVAFFGPLYSRLKMSPDQFTLRINRKGSPQSAELPGMVAQSIKYPDNFGRPALAGSATAGVGNDTVTVGPRAPQSRFPGDGNERTAGIGPTVTEVNEENKIEFRVEAASLPEGEKTLPRSGTIYFYYRGKIKNIHSLDLLYNGTMGKATLKLL